MLASFYLDPYSRPETKNGGAWMAPCIGKSKVHYHACLTNSQVTLESSHEE